MAQPISVLSPRTARSGRILQSGRVAKLGRITRLGRLPTRFNYLLRDTFNTTLSAGSVNGSIADTGQARTVSDVNSKLSIAGGVLDFATGEAVNTGIWYPSIPRKAGLVFIASFTSGNSSSDIRIGLDADQSSTLTNALRFLNNSNVVAITGVSTTTILGFSIVASTLYRIAFVVRNTGFFFFIKGGVFTYWTLIWSEAVNNTNPLFPAILAAGTTTVYTADDVKIPDVLWLPSPLVSDSFNRANGALGSTDGLGHAEQNGGSGLLWNGSTWTINTNKAKNTPSLGSEAYLTPDFASDTNWTKGSGCTITGGKGVFTSVLVGVGFSQASRLTVGKWYRETFDIDSLSNNGLSPDDGTNGVNPIATTTGSKLWTFRALNTTARIITRTGTVTSAQIDNASLKEITLAELFSSLVDSFAADVFASVDVTLVSGTQAGIVINLDNPSSPANFVIAYHDGTNARLDKCVAGTYTSVISAAATYVAGATLRVVKRGTSYTLYYNNALVGTLSTISDAGIIRNSKHGMFSTYEGNTLDNFIIRPTGTNNEYAQLDVF